MLRPVHIDSGLLHCDEAVASGSGAVQSIKATELNKIQNCPMCLSVDKNPM